MERNMRQWFTAAALVLGLQGTAIANSNYEKCMVNPWMQRMQAVVPICLQVVEDKSLSQYQSIAVLDRLGDAYYLTGDFGAAEKYTDDVLEVSPGNYDAKLRKIWINYLRGDASGAFDAFTELIDRHPEKVDGFFGIAFIYSAFGKTDEAVTAYQQALKVDPNYFRTYLNLAGIFESRRELKRAHETLDAVLRRDEATLRNDPFFASDPTISDFDLKDMLDFNKANIYRLDGKAANTLSLLEPLVAKFPRNARVHASIAEARYDLKDFHGALTAAQKSNALGTCYRCAAEMEVRLLAILGRHDDVVSKANEYLAGGLAPLQAAYLQMLRGSSYRKLGKPKEALQSFRTGLTELGQTPWSQLTNLIVAGYYDGTPQDTYNEKIDNALQACILDPECTI
jgi:tetratricopeptide (TPR) repeat protein